MKQTADDPPLIPRDAPKDNSDKRHEYRRMWEYVHACKSHNFFNKMLLDASHEGDRQMCEIAISHGATNFNEMLMNAAWNGTRKDARGTSRELCELAIVSGA